MSKGKIKITIEGGTIPYTNYRSALSFVERGWADWVELGRVIRMRESAEAALGRRVASEMERDRMYWRQVAVERGGLEVEFEWRASAARSPSGVPGMLGMEGRPVVHPERSRRVVKQTVA